MDFSSFATIGFFVLIILISFLLIVYFYQKREKSMGYSNLSFPPSNYMKNVGSKCPDNWIYQSTINGKDNCSNTYNFDFNQQCNNNLISDTTYPTISFTGFSNWPPNPNDPGDLKALQERQMFGSNCGSYTDIDNISFK